MPCVERRDASRRERRPASSSSVPGHHLLYDVEYYKRALLRFEDKRCDDTNIEFNPLDQHCHIADDDCTGVVDDTTLDTIPWYQDGDGDGYGSDAVKLLVCQQPEGFTRDTDRTCERGRVNRCRKDASAASFNQARA